MTYICVYQDNRCTVEAESVIEAAMVYYRHQDVLPEAVYIPEEYGRLTRAEDRLESLQVVLAKRTEERDLAVKKLNDLFHRAKEALAAN